MRSTQMVRLRAWGMKIAKRRGMARARVAVARKLASSCTVCGSTAPNSASAKETSRAGRRHRRGLSEKRRAQRQNRTAERTGIVPVGTMGKAISLRVRNLRAQARKVVKQIETPRSS